MNSSHAIVREGGIIPMGDRVLVERDQMAEKSNGGIIVNIEKDERATRTGVIKAIGKKVEDLAIGKHVLFNKYAGVAYKDDLFFMKQEEILAVIK